MAKAVGIDLGTTFSAAAWVRPDGRTEMIPNSRGDILTPSAVLFRDVEILVGNDALAQSTGAADSLAQWAKRDFGKPLYSRKIMGQQLPPEAIQACILRQLQSDIAKHLNDSFRAVITVPAYFDEPRRRATIEAGRMAGLDVLDIINEPTAAALAYGEQLGYLHSYWDTGVAMRTLVFDLGGGTFDVTMMDIQPRVFTTIATDGDARLGGVDWDKRLADYAATQFQMRTGMDPRLDANSLLELQQQAERAKRLLSTLSNAEVLVRHGGQEFNVPVTRAQFEELTADLLLRTSHTTRSVLTQSGCEWRDVSRILLVGGSTRMPMVFKMLKDMSGVFPDHGVHPDEAVARGAAVYAAQAMEGPGKSIAALDCRITNVNSHSLGVQGVEVETGRRINRIVIAKNTELPVRVTKKFVTTKVDQRSLAVHVLEGESRAPEACTVVGTTIVRNLPAQLPKGTEVYITFEYETNGRLNVSVHVPGTNCRSRLELESSGARTPSQVARWRKVLADKGGFDEVVSAALSELGVPGK